MISYVNPADSTAKPLYFSEAFQAFNDVRAVLPPVPRDEVSRDLKLTAAVGKGYAVWAGDQSLAPHEFYDFSDPKGEGEMAVYLPPTITSFYGHQICAPAGVTVTPLSAARKTRLCLVEFHRLDNDTAREVHAVAWQGDNDTLHLVEPLEHEHEYLGVYPKILFGTRDRRAEEQRDWHLGQVYYGDSALLDVDIAALVQPGKAMRA